MPKLAISTIHDWFDYVEAYSVDAPFVRSPYNYDVSKVSDETGLKCEDASLAVQDARDEVDINTIVRRFGLTGKLPEDVRSPEYGDFTGVTDYHSAMNAVASANESFEQMPADIRSRFHNNPAAFVDFCLNPENADEMRKMGLRLPAAFESGSGIAAALEAVDPSVSGGGLNEPTDEPVAPPGDKSKPSKKA